MRLIGIGVGLLTVLGHLATADAQPARVSVVTIVRPSGSPIEQALIGRVERRLSTRRVTIVHVGELRERIGRIAADRESTAALELTAGRALELDARFVEAAERYGRAVQALVNDPRTLADPRRVAETELSRGAALVEAPDDPGALGAMRAALGYIQDLQADPTFSPNARDVLDRARRAGPLAPALPGRPVLSTAMRARGARFVIYVTLDGGRADRAVRAVVVDARGTRLLDERRPVPPGHDRAVALASAERIAAVLAERIPLPPEPPPFWSSPFFWGAVGIVVAGSVGAGLYFSATQTVSVTVDH